MLLIYVLAPLSIDGTFSLSKRERVRLESGRKYESVIENFSAYFVFFRIFLLIQNMINMIDNLYFNL